MREASWRVRTDPAVHSLRGSEPLTEQQRTLGQPDKVWTAPPGKQPSWTATFQYEAEDSENPFLLFDERG